MLPHCERFAAINIPFVKIGRSAPYHGAERVDVVAERWGEPSSASRPPHWDNGHLARCGSGRACRGPTGVPPVAVYGLAHDTPEPEIVAHLFKLYAEKVKDIRKSAPPLDTKT